jgi:hypothetical protein
MRIALTDLRLNHLVVVYPGDRSSALADHFEVVPLVELTESTANAAGIFRRRRR